jgi:hypothetical protein
MTEQTKAEGPDVGESSEAENGGPEFQRTPGKAEGEGRDDSGAAADNEGNAPSAGPDTTSKD